MEIESSQTIFGGALSNLCEWFCGIINIVSIRKADASLSSPTGTNTTSTFNQMDFETIDAIVKCKTVCEFLTRHPHNPNLWTAPTGCWNVPNVCANKISVYPFARTWVNLRIVYVGSCTFFFFFFLYQHRCGGIVKFGRNVVDAPDNCVNSDPTPQITF